MVEALAEFATRRTLDDLSESGLEQLRLRILDAIACAVGAIDHPVTRRVRAHVLSLDGAERCTLFGGGKAAPDRAALYNGALVRYLDFNDSFLAPNETCHPSDNFAPVLAAAEYSGASGRELLVALAVAYQVQCRLSEVAPVRKRGFDHTTQGAFAAAAGVSRALGLDAERAAHAIAISGTAQNALRVTRTGRLSNWKGLAYPNTAFGAVHAALLAMNGITGPPEVFEGAKGFMETVSGRFEIDWRTEGLDRVERTILKKYNAEVHSQSAIEGLLELTAEHGLRGEDVERIDVSIFDVAYNIIGGGEEGAKTEVHTKEEADHSLPYLLAVALLDGDVMPAQYEPDRIVRSDVQGLLRKIRVHPSEELSRRFPEEMACAIDVQTKDGRALRVQKRDYEGFITRPMSTTTARRKLERLTSDRLGDAGRQRIIEAVRDLEGIEAAELAGLLEGA